MNAVVLEGSRQRELARRLKRFRRESYNSFSSPVGAKRNAPCSPPTHLNVGCRHGRLSTGGVGELRKRCLHHRQARRAAGGNHVTSQSDGLICVRKAAIRGEAVRPNDGRISGPYAARGLTSQRGRHRARHSTPIFGSYSCFCLPMLLAKPSASGEAHEHKPICRRRKNQDAPRECSTEGTATRTARFMFSASGQPEGTRCLSSDVRQVKSVKAA